MGFIVQGKATAQAETQIISSLEYEILTQQETEQTFNVMVSLLHDENLLWMIMADIFIKLTEY